MAGEKKPVACKAGEKRFSRRDFVVGKCKRSNDRCHKVHRVRHMPEVLSPHSAPHHLESWCEQVH